MIVNSPAKVNLFLYVTGKKPDGYHTLFSLMTKIDLYDQIDLDFDTEDIRIKCRNSEVPEDSTNLAYIAAKLFFKKTGIKKGVSIDLDKKIPTGAGLGGGSSNAASVLNALNEYYDNPLNMEDLMVTGLEIGADVPFFLYKGSAIAEGVGEVLESCDLKKYYMILIFPGIGVSTATIFEKLNLTLTKCSKKIKELLLWDRKQNIPVDVKKHLWNDLEIVTANICPEIKAAKNALSKSGAESVLMTGSGSTVFGLFSDEKSAKKGFDFLNNFRSDIHRKWQIFMSEFE
jgi:4-diphosphocytidyl-2-C-methyl-D-erythritol kinase